MVRVKICGLTRVEDALAAEAAGADAIGLVFWEPSKRFVTLERAAAIASALGPFVGRVGVFRDADVDDVLHAVRSLRLTAVQLHGDEPPAYAGALRELVTVIRALPFTTGLSAEELRAYPADGILLDGAAPGSGEAFDWTAATGLRGLPRLIVAGGLTPANVGDVVRELQPYGVDVSSGVEVGPGIKHGDLMEEFVRRARLAELSTVIHRGA